jgi:uncharacterized membrane protein
MSNAQGDPNQPPQRSFLGMPVNWDFKNWYKGMWNADDHRLFPPRRVGFGWTINFREVLRRLPLLH